MKKKDISIVLGIACFGVVSLSLIQMRTIKEATKGIGMRVGENSELRDEVLMWQNNNKEIYEELEKAEAELGKIRKIAAKGNEGAVKIETELKENNKLLGLTEVKGEGIIITVDDNREINTSEVLNVSKFLVHAEDLLNIVNELFNAGADAISINDQRIVNTTAIYCDGNIIRVNGKMIGVPINIKAIGHSERMYYALIRPAGYLEYKGYLRTMGEDGVKATIEKASNITIPKYEGTYPYEYISNGGKS